MPENVNEKFKQFVTYLCQNYTTDKCNDRIFCAKFMIKIHS